MFKSTFVHRLTKVLVNIMFYGGIICLVALPFAVPRIMVFMGHDMAMSTPYMIILFVSGLCALYILWQLRILFRSLTDGNPFTDANVSCFRKCAVASFLIALTSIVRIILWWTMAAAVIVIVFGMLSLFCLTLKDVFKQAVAYKEENDGTI